MERNWKAKPYWKSKESNKQKHQFKSYYCSNCKQAKPCGVLAQSECCACYFQNEQEKAQEYSDYQLVYQRKAKEKREHDKQLQLLKNYQGCSQCSSLEVDAYSWYEKNQLVCQPCLMKKAGSSSSPISFLGQQKWYKRFWKVDLGEWLENYGCLPVNADCAREWLIDKEHLKSCQCLEAETKELHLLFTSSLKEMEEKLKDCQCESSKKVRVSSDNYAWCEKCQEPISVASKKRVIKNRNDPRFWGLEAKEKVLCGNCLESKKGEMKPLRRAKFNEYRKLEML